METRTLGALSLHGPADHISPACTNAGCELNKLMEYIRSGDLLPLPGDIVIRCVCWLVGWFVR